MFLVVVERERHRGRGEREMNSFYFFFYIICFYGLYYFIGLYVKIRNKMFGILLKELLK